MGYVLSQRSHRYKVDSKKEEEILLTINAYTDTSRLVQRALLKKTPFIAVSINYRLGIFGFGGSSDVIAAQHTSNTSFRGVNFGLYDQKLAFTWVKNNIPAFGGDNTKTTIMGHSAGGISSYLHLLQVELSTEKPLFQKAGILSGPIGGLDLTTMEKADKRWSNLYRFWSVEADNPVVRLDILKRIPAKDLLDSVSELKWRFFNLIVDELTIRKSTSDFGISVHLGQDLLEDEIKSSDGEVEGEKVQVMISGADEEFRNFTLIANYNYDRFCSLFIPCYPSVEEAEEVLQMYGVLPTLSDEKLFEAMSWLFSDSTGMHKVYRGYKYLKAHREKQASLHGRDSLGLQYHHFEIGNPFPGPLHTVAHHGVELIYGFDNFHDALKKVDQGILQASANPKDNPIDQRLIHAEKTEYRKSNIDISHELQDKWIQFVVEDCQETSQRANTDDITTFCADRSVRIESWQSDKWIGRSERLELLEKNYDSITKATQKLVGSVSGMLL